MTSVDLVRSTALTDTVPYAHAAVTPPGRLVFTAGACPLDQNGVVVGPGDVAAQAQQAMANLAVALNASDAVLTDVAKTTVFVASSSRADLVTAWEVIRRRLRRPRRAEHVARCCDSRLSGPARRGRGCGGHAQQVGAAVRTSVPPCGQNRLIRQATPQRAGTSDRQDHP